MSFSVPQLQSTKDELSRKEREYASLQLQAETLKRQHQETLHHVSVVKEQLAAKEKQVTMLQTDVSLTVSVSLFSSNSQSLSLGSYLAVSVCWPLSLSHLSLSPHPLNLFFITVFLSVCLSQGL